MGVDMDMVSWQCLRWAHNHIHERVCAFARTGGCAPLTARRRCAASRERFVLTAMDTLHSDGMHII